MDLEVETEMRWDGGRDKAEIKLRRDRVSDRLRE